MNSGVSRYRTLIEWSLGALAVTTVVLVMLWVESPVRQQALSFFRTFQPEHYSLRMPQPVAYAGRSVWRLCMDHQPLAGFAGVAVVLVVFMRRMR